MILLDADVLSAFAKVGKLSLLYKLFSQHFLYISPAVLAEIKVSLDKGHDFTIEIFELLERGQLKVLVLDKREKQAKQEFPVYLGEGEKENIAICKMRGGVLLSNEKKVEAFCKTMKITCLRIPAILRAFWEIGVVTIDEVRDIVEEIREKDRMGFTERALKEIFEIEGPGSRQ